MRSATGLRKNDHVNYCAADEQAGLALHQHLNSKSKYSSDGEVGDNGKNQFHVRDDRGIGILRKRGRSTD